MRNFLKELVKTVITVLVIVPALIIGKGLGLKLWSKIETKFKK